MNPIRELMPRLFLFEEAISAGRASPLGAKVVEHFRAEGQAMLLSLATDFASLPEFKVHVCCAPELAATMSKDVPWQWFISDQQPDKRLAVGAQAADACIVIAPECGGLLAKRAEQVLTAGGRLWGPQPDWIRLAADKHRLNSHLAAHNVPVPTGCLVRTGDCWPASISFPAIIKPCDGAGSDGVQQFSTAQEFATNFPSEQFQFPTVDEAWLCEAYCPGIAASIAVLNGPESRQFLLAGQQNLVFDTTGKASYHGGRLPLPSELQQRATQLASRVLDALEPTLGYIGLDLVLGANADGQDDFLIEVNPRMTTAYLGLRQLATSSIAAAWAALAQGKPCGDRTWSGHTLEFNECGELNWLAAEQT